MAGVFSAPARVCISSMNATALYFESSMAQESTEIARGLRRRDPDLLDRLIEQYQHRLLRYLVYLTGRRVRLLRKAASSARCAGFSAMSAVK